MLENGTLVDGKYEILSKVGQGGMSVVYLAINRKAMKQWAIKEVRRDGVKDFEVVKQSLVAETDMLKKLSHPNLPDIVDIIENEDSFLIVMDYIEGESLDRILEQNAIRSANGWKRQVPSLKLMLLNGQSSCATCWIICIQESRQLYTGI